MRLQQCVRQWIRTARRAADFLGTLVKYLVGQALSLHAPDLSTALTTAFSEPAGKEPN